MARPSGREKKLKIQPFKTETERQALQNGNRKTDRTDT
jgi:hypothetical protein